MTIIWLALIAVALIAGMLIGSHLTIKFGKLAADPWSE